jgi:hypothetical protein
MPVQHGLNFVQLVIQSSYSCQDLESEQPPVDGPTTNKKKVDPPTDSELAITMSNNDVILVQAVHLPILHDNTTQFCLGYAAQGHGHVEDRVWEMSVVGNRTYRSKRQWGL